jgi:hypothetical protein
MLQLRIQCGAGCIGFILRDLRAVVVSLFRGLLVQDVLRMVTGPWREIGGFYNTLIRIPR